MGSDSAAFEVVMTGVDNGTDAMIERGVKMLEEYNAALVKIAKTEHDRQVMSNAKANYDQFSQEQKDALLNIPKLPEKVPPVPPEVKGSVIELNQALEIGQKVVDGLSRAYEMTIGSTLEYGQTVRTVAAEMGLEYEEASRMIDLTDTFSVSTGNLAAAQKNLADQGLTLNIDTLKKLADEYGKLGTQQEKTNFLSEKLGARSGLAFADMFEQGSDAIDKYYNSVSRSMTLTRAQEEELRNYGVAVSDVGDAWQGLANSITFAALPALQKGAEFAQNAITAADLQWQLEVKIAEVQERRGQGWLNWLGIATNGATDQAKAELAMNEAVGIAMGFVNKSSDDAKKESSKNYSELMTLIQSVGQETENYATTQEDLTQKQADAKAKLDHLKEGYVGYNGAAADVEKKLAGVNTQVDRFIVGIDGTDQDLNKLKKQQEELKDQLSLATPVWGQNVAAVDAAQKKYDEITAQINAAATAHEAAMKKTAYSNFMQIESSKEMTAEEFKKQQQVGVALGIFTQAEADTAIRLDELSRKMAAGTITAEEYANAVKRVDQVSYTPTTNPSDTGQQSMEDWKKKQEAIASAQQSQAQTGQQAAQAWQDAMAADWQKKQEAILKGIADAKREAQGFGETGTTPQPQTGTGQAAAAAWQDAQKAVQQAQSATKTLADNASKNVTSFTDVVTKQSNNAAQALDGVLGRIATLRGQTGFNISVSFSDNTSGGTGSEYP